LGPSPGKKILRGKPPKPICQRTRHDPKTNCFFFALFGRGPCFDCTQPRPFFDAGTPNTIRRPRRKKWRRCLISSLPAGENGAPGHRGWQGSPPPRSHGLRFFVRIERKNGIPRPRVQISQLRVTTTNVFWSNTDRCHPENLAKLDCTPDSPATEIGFQLRPKWQNRDGPVGQLAPPGKNHTLAQNRLFFV